MISSQCSALALVCLSVCAQQHGPLGAPGPLGKATTAAPSMRVTVGLTVVPVTVTDQSGKAVLGLTRERFRVFEDGVEQQVKFLQVSDAPVSVAVLFDASRSMTGKLGRARDAVGQFFTSAGAGDEFLLVEFNDTPRLLCPFTVDTASIQSSLLNITPRNWTALFDAVYMGIHHSHQARNLRRALLILSDGADNHSRYSEAEVRSLVRESDVAIYGLGLVGAPVLGRPDRVLRQLSEQTGGLYRPVEKIGDLLEAVSAISAAMHEQYQLGYSSDSSRRPGLYRRIEVRIEQPPGQVRLRVNWRRGYFPDAP